ncbi:MAG TPA: hypothetical protein VGA75_02945 [Paracoccaceae bacterium]|jgi:hypothetical protein
MKSKAFFYRKGAKGAKVLHAFCATVPMVNSSSDSTATRTGMHPLCVRDNMFPTLSSTAIHGGVRAFAVNRFFSI